MNEWKEQRQQQRNTKEQNLVDIVEKMKVFLYIFFSYSDHYYPFSFPLALHFVLFIFLSLFLISTAVC